MRLFSCDHCRQKLVHRVCTEAAPADGSADRNQAENATILPRGARAQ